MAFDKDKFSNADFSTAEDNVLKKFYIPALKESVKYDGAIGFFTTYGLYRVLQGIEGLVENKGKMRLVIGYPLKDEEYKALQKTNNTKPIFSELKDKWINLYQEDHSEVGHHRLELFSWLFNNGYLEIKYAIRRKGMYHKKIGILQDTEGTTIAFAGSINFTDNALKSHIDEPDGSSEQFDVFPSWEVDEFKRHGESKITQFESVWSNREANTETLEIPSDHYKEIQDYFTKNEPPKSKIEQETADLYDRIIGGGGRTQPIIGGGGRTQPIIGGGRETPPIIDRKKKIDNLFKHQSDSLIEWKNNNYRGIFEHATGSGKTVTALKAIDDHLKTGGAVLILVPSELLFKQWQDEINSEIDKPVFLLAGGGNNKWKKNNTLKYFVAQSVNEKSRIVLSIIKTASSDEFISSFKGVNNLLIVVDEVHQMGSEMNSRSMEIDPFKRLGLSATPKRYGDPEGTEKIIKYFEKIIQPPFTLYDAIKAKRLVPYEYFPGLIHLTVEESEEWKTLTTEIRKEIARTNKDRDTFFISPRAKTLTLRRSRIAKKSKAKLKLVKKVIKNSYEKGQKWLVYCEDIEQLNEVKEIITNLNHEVFEYHSKMIGDNDQTLALYEHRGGILVSIKCLDEGVDIPSISHALIIASSQNPRQFIQRRGRVLRVHGDQKKYAVIHDALIVPIDIEKEPEQLSLLKSEMIRAFEFANNALNPSSKNELRIKAADLGFDLSDIIDDGVEEDLEEDLNQL